jgi:hypothetical protein
MAQFGERSERDGGIVRGLAARYDFQTETGPEDGHAARERRYAGFGDAKDSHAHRSWVCTRFARKPLLKRKGFRVCFVNSTGFTRLRL